MNKMIWAVFACGLLALGAMAGGGCGTGHHQSGAGDAPTQLFGTWRLVKITGGFTGQGVPIPSQPQTLTFEQNGTVTQSGGGLATVQKTYHVVRRKTLLSSNIVPVVEYGDGSLSQIIEQVDAQNLALVDEANDGFGYRYIR